MLDGGASGAELRREVDADAAFEIACFLKSIFN